MSTIISKYTYLGLAIEACRITICAEDKFFSVSRLLYSIFAISVSTHTGTSGMAYAMATFNNIITCCNEEKI